jgi:hypothetical protein
MNMAIPVDIKRINEGRRILFRSNLRLTNGGIALLSITTKMGNEIADIINAPAICNIFSLFTPICIIVSAIRNEAIVTERVTIPLISIENGLPFFSDTSP